MIGISDGLLSDYSSVAVDYLLLDRPLGYVLADYDMYKEKRGFVFENPYDYMPGYKISNYGDVLSFIEDVIEGNDRYAKERRELNKKINFYNDGKSCERVVAKVFRRHNS